MGTSIELKKDSSYIYTTCGNIEEGIWKMNGNKIVLKCQEKKMRIDSLNDLEKYIPMTICRENYLVFYVKNEVLYSKENWRISEPREVMVKQKK